MKSTTLVSAWKTASRKEELFYNEGGETLEQVAQKTGGCPSLETFKVRLDQALSILVKLNPLTAGGLDVDDL